MKKERLMLITLFSILLVSLLSCNVSAITVDDVFDNPLVSFITTVIFGMQDRAEVESKIGNERMNAISTFIVFIFTWLILFVAFSDIIKGFSPFSPLVSWIIGFGITVIMANFGFIQLMVIYGFGAVIGTLGIVGIILGILISIGVFVAVSFGGNRLSVWAAQRRAGIDAARGKVGATEAASGLEALRKVHEASTRRRI